MKKNRIALITTYFPPQKSVATNRMLAFVEFLKVDFEIAVFCLGDQEKSTLYKEETKVFYSSGSWIQRKAKHQPSDQKLQHHFKTGINLILNKVYKNPLSKWQKSSLAKLKSEHQNTPFDFVISSHAPPEAHLVASEFIKENKQIPWLADMRDEMSLNPGVNAAQKKHLQEIEHIVNTYAKAITSVSLPILNDFRRICPKITLFEEVRNGFNHDYKNPFNKASDTIFRFGYFGTFYGERKPQHFFKALENILKSKPEVEFEIHLFGVHKNYEVPNVLIDRVFVQDSLPYLEAIHKMGEMDANLLILPKVEQKGVFSGKVFDYISVQKPVFACVDTTDVAAELIQEINAGYVAEFDDVNVIQTEIENAFKDKADGILKIANTEQVNSLHRKNQVQKLNVLIHKLLVS